MDEAPLELRKDRGKEIVSRWVAAGSGVEGLELLIDSAIREEIGKDRTVRTENRAEYERTMSQMGR